MLKPYMLSLSIMLTAAGLRAQVASDYAVQLTASTQLSPPQIKLQWSKLSGATGYTLSKKRKTDGSFSLLANLPSTDSTYSDAAVVADSVYEYRIVKTGSVAATGYCLAGIQAQPIHGRGYCIVLVDTLFRDSCKAEIARLMADLRGDGWGLIRHDVRRDASVPAVRSVIQADYAAHAEVNSLLLLGHIPVPYSGNLNPDGHPDHEGAWPADGYYADVDGVWNDVSVNNTIASRTQNRNIPGDGKWDETVLPSELDLQTGRIDFANMPAISRSEVTLMRSYLNKAHSYKMDSVATLRKAAIDDNFGGFGGEAFAANGWRIFPPMVGRSNISTGDFETVLKDSAYQWAYGCGAGGYNSCANVGVTTDFNTLAVKGIFTMTFGSYFGDWDAANSFLKAPLCGTEPALTSCWAGRPNWFFHQMALGESIGYCARLSQNNGGLYAPTNYGAGFVHAALMGDPSLRTDYIKPPKNLSVTSTPKAGATLTWSASSDAGVIGYYVYRSDSVWGLYSRISGITATTSFTDSKGVDGRKYYLVRPVKLVQTPSGGYYNLGLGIVDSANVTYPLGVATVAAIQGLSIFPNPATTHLQALIDCQTSVAATLTLINATGSVLMSKTLRLHAGANTISTDVATLPAGMYLLEVHTSAGVMSRTWIKE